MQKKQGIITHSLFFCHIIRLSVNACRTIFGKNCKFLLTYDFFCDKLKSQIERRVIKMTNENKITELRTFFDKIVDEWDMEKLYSPRLVQMARNIEDQLLSLS